MAPATANIIAKAALGLADEIVSTVILAFDGPIIVAPAMNWQMWCKPPMVRNVAQLRADGMVIVGTRGGAPELRRGRGRTDGGTGSDFQGHCRAT